jgi:hypothetical protein
MDETRERPIGEKTVLSHAPVPGYRKAFYAAVAAGVAWLLVSFTGAL